MNGENGQQSLSLFDDSYSDSCVVTLHKFEDLTYNLSDMGQAVFFEILCKLDSRKPHTDQVIVVSAQEMVAKHEAFSRTTVYRDFEKACGEVRKMMVYEISETEEHVIIADFNVFDAGRVHYQKDKKTKKRTILKAEFRIHPEIAPHLTMITGDMRFNTFLIQQSQKLKRSESARLYQWLRRHHFLKKQIGTTTSVDISADQLRYKLAFNRGHLPSQWKHFNPRILQPAIKEVNASTDLQTSFTVIERGLGGRIEKLRFKIWDKPEVIEGECVQDQEGDYIDGKAHRLSEELEASLLNLVPDLEAKELAGLAVQHEDVIRAAMVAFVKAKNVKKPVPYLLKLVEGLAKDYSKEKKGPEAKTTEDKLTNRDWDNVNAVYDDLFGDM